MRSPSSRPSNVMSRGLLSHCGGMAKRNVPSVNSILAIGRALPPDPTNCPTRVAVPDRSTSSHDGDVCVPRCTTRSHRPSSASDAARDCAKFPSTRGREHQRGAECDASNHASSSFYPGDSSPAPLHARWRAQRRLPLASRARSLRSLAAHSDSFRRSSPAHGEHPALARFRRHRVDFTSYNDERRWPNRQHEVQPDLDYDSGLRRPS